jgi:iron complex transport system permease protein
VLVILAVLLIAIIIMRMHVSTAAIGWPTGDAADFILQNRRFLLILGLIVGVALATSGVALQALLRNPLAEPFILGLSTGAAAGVMAQSLLYRGWHIPQGANAGGALIGAAASMIIVFLASRRKGMIDPLGLLLTGVVLSTINGALIMLLNYAVGPGGIRDDLAQWMMGFLNDDSATITVYITAAVTAAGLALLIILGRAMDVASFSDTEAQSLGVNLARLRTILFLTASILAAGAVVLAGPIAFVGLISPHLARILLGPGHRALLIGSAMIGAGLIVLADILSSLIGYVGITAFDFQIGKLPIGIFTAMIGGPAFLWMLRPQLGRSQS